MTTLKPINFHCEILPIAQDAFIGDQDTNTFEEKGTIISIADEVTKVKVGQVCYFDSWLCTKYPDADGKLRYLIQEENIRAIEINDQSTPEITV